MLEIVQLIHTLNNLIAFGRVIEVQGPTARVRVREMEPEQFFPCMAMRAGDDRTWWSLSEGEQVLMVCPSGNLENAVIIGSLNQKDFPPPETDPNIVRHDFSDETYFSYDKSQGVMTLFADHLPADDPGDEGGAAPQRPKKLIVEFSGDIDFYSGGRFLFDGKHAEFTGTLHAKKTISSDVDIVDKVRSMADDRTIYNGHDHAGVKSGSDTSLKPGAQQ